LDWPSGVRTWLQVLTPLKVKLIEVLSVDQLEEDEG
jgi:hypothetical protein